MVLYFLNQLFKPVETLFAFPKLYIRGAEKVCHKAAEKQPKKSVRRATSMNKHPRLGWVLLTGALGRALGLRGKEKMQVQSGFF